MRPPAASTGDDPAQEAGGRERQDALARSVPGPSHERRRLVGIGLAPDPAVAAVMRPVGLRRHVWNVVTVSLRQQIVPAPLLGRANSVYRMLGWGLMPVGALAGVRRPRGGPTRPLHRRRHPVRVSILAAVPRLLSDG